MIKRFVILALLLASFQSCHVARFFIYNFADIRDYKKFPKNELKKSNLPFNFVESPFSKSVKLPATLNKTNKSKKYNFEDGIRKNGTVAFLVIRNDSIIYQWYRKGYDKSSIVPSFSMAKSFVSALIGIAIDEGKIKNTEEPITNYIDFEDKAGFGKITIQHLLDMRSGIKFNENYFNPFGNVAKYYYGRNLKKYIKRLSIKEEPGKTFEYISVNTQLLGLIIEKATGKSISEYLQEKIWSKIGMEFDASWSIDSKKHKTEKAFCCINARAKDFAKFGRLYLNKGNYNGMQIISQKWIDESVNFRDNKNYFLYSNQWWHNRNYKAFTDSSKLEKPFFIMTNINKEGKTTKYAVQPSGDFFADGFLGQYIYVSPKSNIIIVRLGKTDGWMNWPGLFKEIAIKNQLNK